MRYDGHRQARNAAWLAFVVADADVPYMSGPAYVHRPDHTGDTPATHTTQMVGVDLQPDAKILARVDDQVTGH